MVKMIDSNDNRLPYNKFLGDFWDISFEMLKGLNYLRKVFEKP